MGSSAEEAATATATKPLAALLDEKRTQKSTEKTIYVQLYLKLNYGYFSKYKYIHIHTMYSCMRTYMLVRVRLRVVLFVCPSVLNGVIWKACMTANTSLMFLSSCASSVASVYVHTLCLIAN